MATPDLKICLKIPRPAAGPPGDTAPPAGPARESKSRVHSLLSVKSHDVAGAAAPITGLAEPGDGVTDRRPSARGAWLAGWLSVGGTNTNARNQRSTPGR